MSAARLVLLALLGAATLLGCERADDTGAMPATSATPDEDRIAFHFELDGLRPRDNTLYYAVGSDVDGKAPYVGTIVDATSIFVIEGRPGDAYHMRTEPRMTPADTRMRWTVDLRGTLGDASTADGKVVVKVASPARARIHVVASLGMAGPDFLTLFDEGSKTAACAVRDPSFGMITAAWDSAAGNALREAAPPRPWVVEEFAPGRCVIGARTHGRQWMALRADVGPGTTIDMDVGRQPSGGGTVICEDSGAVLLLGGEFPIPAPRLTTNLQFRSKWDGVPPGKHKVRYPDGRVEDINVTDGDETRLGR